MGIMDKILGRRDWDAEERAYEADLQRYGQATPTETGRPSSVRDNMRSTIEDAGDRGVHFRNIKNVLFLQDPRPIVANKGETVLVHRQTVLQRLASKLNINFMQVKDEIIAAFSDETADREANYGSLEVIENAQPELLIEGDDEFETADGDSVYVKLYVNYVLDLCKSASQEHRAALANYYKYELKGHEQWVKEVASQVRGKLEELIHQYSTIGVETSRENVKKMSSKKAIEKELRDFIQNATDGACALASLPSSSSLKLEQIDDPLIEKVILRMTGGKPLKQYVREQCTSADEPDQYDPVLGQKLTADILKAANGNPDTVLKLTGGKDLGQYVKEQATRKGKKGSYDAVAGQQLTESILKAARVEAYGEDKTSGSAGNVNVYERKGK